MATDATRSSLPVGGQPQSGAAKVGRSLLQFLELQLPMGLGALVCYLVIRLIPASSGVATVYRPGTYLFAAGDMLFLTVPVVAWMNLRGRGWRRSLELAGAMLAPVAATVALGRSAGYAELPWLPIAVYPVMCLGMGVYVLCRPQACAYGAQACAAGSSADVDLRSTAQPRVTELGTAGAAGSCRGRAPAAPRRTGRRAVEAGRGSAATVTHR